MDATTQSIMFFSTTLTRTARARVLMAPRSSKTREQDTARNTGSDRSYGRHRSEGHLWWVTQRLRNPPAH